MTVLLGNFPRSFSLPRAPNLKHSPFAHFQILGNHQAESAEIGNIIECCEGNQVDRAVAAQLQDCRFASHHIVPIHFARGGSYSLRVWISATHNPTQGVAHARNKHLPWSRGEPSQYQHTKRNFEKSGHSGRRAGRVAARTVMKQHKEKGHRKRS